MESAAAAAAYMDEVLALFENVTYSVRKQWKHMAGQGSFWEPILAFIHAVDWTEPWLIGLMCTHVVLLMLAVLTRRNNKAQMILFFSALVCVYFAERLNSILDRHWKSFARQPYFDRHGVFLSTVWSVPLLLMSTLILVNSLLTLSKLLVKWKTAELKHRARLAREKKE
ncbi:transmembrane protein 18 [Marchantia polymorpha subsp. ruderalis]|uniref:Transmembrane protein 18 n=2 Tax=Marchantia polymorpha TaxID=3197 RepID=A0AAF6AYP0_MARPO|nr:hypothetical protein MARPO_0118s0004 [Marchantia polymorpha]BBN04874.1 hypothetical protein Mp_3g08460 [Marchantia polymorpha subsp. ruderalis]|eukprot:PTQ30866.1 hypothetical protein MARPO_0118s0004 [Marchantia polymorpha]